MGGKLHPKLLERYVFTRVGIRDPAVVVGPGIGEDAAIVDLGDGRVLVAHVDPITGAVEHLGWLAVHVACNDIAVRGAKPRWLLSVLYLPEKAGEELIDKITAQIDEAAKEVEAMVVGGHTEFTPGLDRPLISMTAIGVADRGRIVTTSGARAGDVVIMTKTVAVEGTAILATDFRDALLRHGVPLEVIERGKRFLKLVSVVKEALLLAEKGLATSMHDPTEGGLIGGLAEIAYASKKTIAVYEERIPVAEETAVMTRALGLDPLKLISSGVLIATVPKDKALEAVEILRRGGVNAAVIGEVREYTGHLVVVHRRGGVVEEIDEPYVKDELTNVWERYAH
jgi:hydrogenase maturation factor